MNVFSFFAGAGFLDLGFEMTGHFDVVYVNEFHRTFNDIYRFYCASVARKALPLYGEYEKCGWSEKMTGAGL